MMQSKYPSTKEEIFEIIKAMQTSDEFSPFPLPISEVLHCLVYDVLRKKDPVLIKDYLFVLEQNAEWFVSNLSEFATASMKKQAEERTNIFEVFSFAIIKSKNRPKKSSAATLKSERQTNCGDDYWRIRRVYQVPHDNERLNTFGGWMALRNKIARMNVPNKSSVLLNLPNYNKNVLISNTRKLLTQIDFREKTKELYYTGELSRCSVSLDTLCDSLFRSLYPKLKGEIGKYLFPLFQEIASNPQLDYHDHIVFPIDTLSSLLSPAAVKIFLQMQAEERRKWVELSIYNTHNEELAKTLRRKVLYCLKKGVSAEDTGNELERLTAEFTLRQYDLSFKQVEHIIKYYLPVLKRYNNRASVSQFLSVFGKNGVKKILAGPPCIFSPAEYKLPSLEKTVVASVVTERLGCLQDDNNLKARKRLYARLSRVAPVSDIQNGNFKEELIPLIKRELNLSPDKPLSLSQKFVAKIEKKASPEFLIAGDASVCCMSMGAEKAITYAMEKGFGVFNVYFDNRIIANSVLWVNNHDTLVIDNIEVHPNYKKHNEYIKEMYHQMIKDMSKTYPNIVQGCTYNDLTLYPREKTPREFERWNPIDIKKTFYSDATCSVLVRGDESIYKNKKQKNRITELLEYDERNALEEAPLPFALRA